MEKKYTIIYHIADLCRLNKGWKDGEDLFIYRHCSKESCKKYRNDSQNKFILDTKR